MSEEKISETEKEYEQAEVLNPCPFCGKSLVYDIKNDFLYCDCGYITLFSFNNKIYDAVQYKAKNEKELLQAANKINDAMTKLAEENRLLRIKNQALEDYITLHAEYDRRR